MHLKPTITGTLYNYHEYLHIPLEIFIVLIVKLQLKADLRDSAGSVPEHHNKMNIAIKSHECFGFPVHIRVMFTLYCSPLGVQ